MISTALNQNHHCPLQIAQPNSGREHLASSAPKTETTDPTKVVNEVEAPKFNVDQVVGNILDFVRQRLETADPKQQADLLEQAKRGVEIGFADAKDIIQSVGKMNDEMGKSIDSALDQILAKLDDPEGLLSEAGSKLEEVDWHQSEAQSLSLSLTTRQGDKVEIRYQSLNEQQGSWSSNGQDHQLQWQGRQQQGYQLSVVGDLNEQERSAIHELLQDVNQIAGEFFHGDYQTAFEKAQQLGLDSRTLQGFNLSMTETSIQAMQSYQQHTDQPVSLPKGLSALPDFLSRVSDMADQLHQHATLTPDWLTSLTQAHPLMQHQPVDWLTKLIS